MTLMWLFTATCMYLIIPKITFVGISNGRALIILTALQLSSLVIGACVTCTDPVLSQALAKGAFADKVRERNILEIQWVRESPLA